MRLNKRRREDRKKKGEEGGAPGWMVTYGDLMSLLLTFFVLLVSFSSIQLVEFQKAMGSLKGALGVLKHKEAPTPNINLDMTPMGGKKKAEFNAELNEMLDYIEKEGLEDSISVEVTENGIAIRMMEPIMFDLGKADLKPRVFPLLNKIAEMARAWPNMIRIEGHTDDLPIHTPEFPSNWELSAIRAINVIHYFEDVCGIDPKKLYYLGYGENKPLVPNTSPENRAKNRRVEIYFEKEPKE
jgi:chemotaxis protein MotB